MFINFSNTELSRVIIHRINKKGPEQQCSSVECEDTLFDMDGEAMDIIKERLNNACGARSKSFILQIADVSPESFFDKAKGLWSLEREDFIKKTQEIADLLGESQRRRNIPGGYLLVLDGIETNTNFRFVIVIKAELQDAFTTSVNEKTKRKQLEVLKDIFLSPAKKFFKIGILKQAINHDKTFPNNDYSCLLHDDQFNSGGNPAEFFYENFLGFSADRNTKFLTRDFFKETKEVIKGASNNYEEKSNALIALKNLFNQDQTGIINPREFGEQFLTGDIRDRYARVILTNPKFDYPFHKDSALMGRMLDSRKINFSEKVVIQGPENIFDENVQIIKGPEEIKELLEDSDTNYTLLKIKGKPYGDS